MRRFVHTLSLAGVCFLAATALGATVRFQSRPETADNGTTLTVHGRLAGLSGQDFTVQVRATGTATVQCINPAGNEPAGQERREPVIVTADQTFPGSAVVQGSASFDVTTAPPSVRADCPGERWTSELRDVTFRTVTIRVMQDGRMVLRRSYTI
jgi:hypothetical protein